MSARIKKTCPDCARPLKVRTNGETGQKFLGCTEYPDCRYTEPLPEDLVMRIAGAATLPGIEL